MTLLTDAVAGMLLGVTGLVPFLHTNTLLAFAGTHAFGYSAVFIAAFAASHAVFEIIPAMALSWPSESNSGFLGLPPRGFGAIIRMASIALFSMALSLVLLPAYLSVAPAAVALLSPYWGYVLLLASSAFIFSGGPQNRAIRASLYAWSGLLGVMVFASPVSQPLVPLLAGLFGIPAILRQGASLPDGELAGSLWPPLAAGVVLGAASNLVPAMTPAVIAAVALLFISRLHRDFPVLIMAIVSSRLLFDLSGSAFGMAARSAPSLIISGIFQLPDYYGAVAIGSAVLFASAVPLAVLVVFNGRLAQFVCLLSGNKFRAASIGAMALLVVLSSGPLGAVVLLASSATGLAISHSPAGQASASGSLIVPALLHFFGIHALVFSFLY